MALTKDTVAAALRGLDDAGRAGRERARVLWTSVCDTYVSVKLQMAGPAGHPEREGVARAALAAVSDLAGRGGVRLDSFIADFVDDHGNVVQTVRFGGLTPPSSPPPPGGVATTAPAADPAGVGSGGHAPIQGLGRAGGPTAQDKASGLPGVSHVIAVGAGKGGVGKSTIALNLAVGLARRGHAVGLLDADIYGPSMPTMLGLAPLEAMVLQGMLQPFLVHGIKAMTIGKLVDAEKPLIWRGPMAHGAFKQLAEQTQWGGLDYLVIDLPPGTGDVSLTMSQLLRLTGAVVVCTPQKVAQDDAVRAARMFQQLGIPVLGVVENMSCFVGDDGKVYDIFGRGGAEQMAQRLNLPFLGAVPITMSLRANSDTGNPTANFQGADASGVRLRESLEDLVRTFEGQVALASLRDGTRGPTLTIR